jgi:hypothetical protein
MVIFKLQPFQLLGSVSPHALCGWLEGPPEMAGQGEEKKEVLPLPGFEGRRLSRNEPLCLIELLKYIVLIFYFTS